MFSCQKNVLSENPFRYIAKMYDELTIVEYSCTYGYRLCNFYVSFKSWVVSRWHDNDTHTRWMSSQFCVNFYVFSRIFCTKVVHLLILYVILDNCIFLHTRKFVFYFQISTIILCVCMVLYILFLDRWKMLH